MTQQFPSAEEYYQSGEYWKHLGYHTSTFKFRIVIQALSKFNIVINKSLKAAEIGCGHGAFLFPLAYYLNDKKILFELDGYDIAFNAIELAKKRNKFPDNINFRIGSAKDLPFGYDIIFCIDVLEHVENPRQFLVDLSGKSNYVLLHLPIEHSIAHLLYKYPKITYGLYKHIHFYSWETAKILIEDSPFEILNYQFTGSINDPAFSSGTIMQRCFRKLRWLSYKFYAEKFAVVMGGPVFFLLKNR